MFRLEMAVHGDREVKVFTSNNAVTSAEVSEEDMHAEGKRGYRSPIWLMDEEDEGV